MIADKPILDTLPYGIIVTDANLRLEMVNAWLQERYPFLQPPQPGQPLEEVFSELKNLGLMTAFELVKQSHLPFTFSTRIHKYFFKLPAHFDSGMEYMPQSTTILPVFENNQLTWIVIIIQDVTDRVRTENELQFEIHKLSVLHEIDHAISTLDLQTCLEIIAQHTRSVFQAGVSAVFLAQPALELVQINGMEPGAIPDLHGSLVERCFTLQSTTLIQDVKKQLFRPIKTSSQSVLVVPIVDHDTCLGVLTVEKDEPDSFSRYDLDLLEGLAARSAVAITNARYFSESERWRAYHQAINDYTGDVIYTVDTELRLTGANAGWDHFARENGGQAWLSSKIQGRHLLSAFSGAEREKWEKITQQLLSGELESYRDDLPCHSPTEQRWLNQFVTALRDSHQHIIGLIFTTREITQRLQIENELRSTNFRLGTLLTSINIMSEQQHNIQMMLESVVWLISDVFKAESVVYFRLPEGSDKAETLVVLDQSAEQVGQAPVLRSGIEEVVEVLDITGILADASRVIDGPAAVFSQYSALYAMVCTRSNTVGGILLLARHDGPGFTMDQKEILGAIAQQLGLYLENAGLYAEQQRMAKTDSLTGLHNRRRMNEELEIEIQHQTRYHRPVSVLMLDIDNFKRFNDSFGHPIGDKLLVKLAAILQRHVRAVDLVVRYGGEEFVIILPETDASAAHLVAERVRASVAEEAASVIWDEAPEYQVTVSIGIAAAPVHDNTAEGLLRAADIAMYQAKRAGKNQVVVAQPKTVSA